MKLTKKQEKSYEIGKTFVDNVNTYLEKKKTNDIGDALVTAILINKSISDISDNIDGKSMLAAYLASAITLLEGATDELESFEQKCMGLCGKKKGIIKNTFSDDEVKATLSNLMRDILCVRLAIRSADETLDDKI